MTNPATKIVIAAPTFYSMFQAEICKQIKKWLKSEESSLRSMTDDADEQKKRLMFTLTQTKPSALITISIQPDEETVAAYNDANIPIVLIDEETDGVSTITTNNFLGGRLAGEFLMSKGKNKIAIVSGRTQVKGGYNAKQRLMGFQQALSAGGQSISPERTIEVDHYSREDGIEVMPKLLSIDLDAIFCAAGDNCALGLLTIAKQQGVRIPEDIAIVGFDDLLAARVSNPALTTIKQPLEKMAESAYKMAVTQRDEILRKPQKTIFDPELIERQSA
ncbi:LacI family DNA-binding transcriptional regulator [bacterium]